MAQLYSYLTFNGNCRQAMTFYQSCLGGELELQTIGQAPLSEPLPDNIKAYIVQATLRKDNLVLMATDMVANEGLNSGNSVSLLLNCQSEQELHHYYHQLAQQGQATQPLATNFWGAIFGSVTDQFGIRWLLNYDKG
ncbi:VOC family protein [Pedobacter sp. KR3-3]|uniref:VOC family protein n=1 Tax=Pedobacter albus TaxID=3113905 RepID=A0ABU7I657_9SPHI|nr:VOC family protein [Pedobacter sp. KR3-3]MEE1944854.1 VOC family protein [Pedobacter sp. KR3-3]